jgi:hypothetical protein
VLVLRVGFCECLCYLSTSQGSYFYAVIRLGLLQLPRATHAITLMNLAHMVVAATAALVANTTADEGSLSWQPTVPANCCAICLDIWQVARSRIIPRTPIWFPPIVGSVSRGLSSQNLGTMGSAHQTPWQLVGVRRDCRVQSIASDCTTLSLTAAIQAISQARTPRPAAGATPSRC